MMPLPPTMLLQIAVSALAAACGLVALAVARAPGPAHPRHRGAWHLAGVTFLAMGACGVLQSAFGSWAILAGEGTPPWTRYLRWAPALNYSRETAELAFLAVLLAGALGGRGAALLHGRAAWAVILLAMAAGLGLGWREGSLGEERHYGTVAVLDAAIFACWALVLSAVVLAGAVDRWLLAALALAAVPLPLNALWFSWLARSGSGAWTPHPLHMQLYRLAFHLLVFGAMAHRWRLARRGEPVSAVGGDPAPMAPR